MIESFDGRLGMRAAKALASMLTLVWGLGSGPAESGSAESVMTGFNGRMREACSSLGIIEGACYDQDSGAISLIGTGEHAIASPTPDQVAVALRWAFADEPGDPFVSIDPVPEDPKGPYMAVAVDKICQDTRFGWVMLEADRKLKALGMGHDNVSLLPAESRVPGYLNMFERNEAPEADRTGPSTCMRFWFYPKENAVQWDTRAVRILSCRMGVRTENMFWKEGRLERKKGIEDPGAKAFAEHFTQNYRQFADEDSVFLELEQQCRLLLVAEWVRKLREQHLPLNLAWMRGHARPHFRMPRYTPSLRVSQTEQGRRGNVVFAKTAEMFGGVDLGVRAGRRPADADFQLWRGKLAPNLPRRPGVAKRIKGEIFGRVAVSLPGSTLRAEISRVVNVVTEVGTTLTLGTRTIQTGRNTIGGDTPSAELALPSLTAYFPNARGVEGGKGSVEVVGTLTSGNVKIRHFELCDAEGRRLGWFRSHDADPVGGGIRFTDPSGNGSWVLRPELENPNVVVAHENGRPRWAFSLPGGEIVADIRGKEVFHYRYNEKGTLARIEAGEGFPLIEFSHTHGRRRIAHLRTSDGQSATFTSAADRRTWGRIADGATMRVTNEVGQTSTVVFSGSERQVKMKSGSEPDKESQGHVSGTEAAVAAHMASSAAKSPGIEHVSVIADGGMSKVVVGEHVHDVAASSKEMVANLSRARALKRSLPPRSKLATPLREAMLADEAAPVKAFLVNTAERSLGRVLANYLQSSNERKLVVDAEDLVRTPLRVKEILSKSDFKCELSLDIESLGKIEGGKELIESFGELAGQPAKDAELVVLLHHAERATSERLASQSKQGRFRGKVVALFACGHKGSQEKLISQLLSDGALGVIPTPADSFANARAMGRLVEEIMSRRPAGSGGQNAVQWLKGVILELKDKVEGDNQNLELRKLLDQFSDEPLRADSFGPGCTEPIRPVLPFAPLLEHSNSGLAELVNRDSNDGASRRQNAEKA